ncbi:retinoic acid receptor RXR-beta-like [Thunnus albacares]|uniref:retinoic acid receptor RXR-beta-like n=1 Tax=Thunnus albacares TaxID=8236 RepID=UPI001CF71419|nr:retinoic acid receptor RXR-beta-like [Thunnus albacares]
MGSAPQTAKGTKEGPSPPPPHSSPPPLRSPILQGADSSKIRKPASPPPAQPHFPVITTTTKGQVSREERNGYSWAKFTSNTRGSK